MLRVARRGVLLIEPHDYVVELQYIKHLGEHAEFFVISGHWFHSAQRERAELHHTWLSDQDSSTHRTCSCSSISASLLLVSELAAWRKKETEPTLALVRRMDRAHTRGEPGKMTVWKPGLWGLRPRD